MMLWVLSGMTLLVLAVAIAALSLSIGKQRQRQATRKACIELLQLASASVSQPVRLENLPSLPAPVVRYFRYALQDGQAHIRVARYRQRGWLRTEPHSERWLPFDASHVVAPPVRGFFWNAHVAIARLLHLRICDAYIGSQASTRLHLQSAFPISHKPACIEMNAGALHRYLAEAVWYPSALLPSAGVTWSAIDDRHALATLTNGSVTVSLEFRFAASGEVTSVYTPARWRSVKEGFEEMPWEGRFREYRRIAGMHVPVHGEAGWYVDGNWCSVWSAQIDDIAYEFPVMNNVEGNRNDKRRPHGRSRNQDRAPGRLDRHAESVGVSPAKKAG